MTNFQKFNSIPKCNLINSLLGCIVKNVINKFWMWKKKIKMIQQKVKNFFDLKYYFLCMVKMEKFYFVWQFKKNSFS